MSAVISSAAKKPQKAAIVDPGGDEQKLLDIVEKENLMWCISLLLTGIRTMSAATGRSRKRPVRRIVMHEDDDDFFSQPKMKNYFSMLGLEPSPPADVRVKEGDVITFGEVSLEVIHTPGHTPGGICLYAQPNVITGDTLFVGGIGRTDFPGGSIRS